MRRPFKLHVSVISKALCVLIIIFLVINLQAFRSSPVTPKPTIKINTFYNEELPSPGVLARPRGGIGNQLFIYACAYAVAREKNWTLYLEHEEEFDWFIFKRKFTPYRREFALDQFHIPELNFYDKTSEISRIGYYTDLEYLDKEIVKQQHNGFIQLSGYCQSEAFWVDYRDEILEMFQPSESVMESFNTAQKLVFNEIKTSDSVAVHIRRGDFLKAEGFFVPISFQRNAIRRMIKILKERNVHFPTFFVFSDDIQFAKRQFSEFEEKYRFIYVSDLKTNSIQDFYLMILCKHIILANSTFAWWAAYLNSNPDKVVIASAFSPDWWTRDNRKIHGTLYHPSSWIVIDVFAGEHY